MNKELSWIQIWKNSKLLVQSLQMSPEKMHQNPFSPEESIMREGISNTLPALSASHWSKSTSWASFWSNIDHPCSPGRGQSLHESNLERMWAEWSLLSLCKRNWRQLALHIHRTVWTIIGPSRPIISGSGGGLWPCIVNHLILFSPPSIHQRSYKGPTKFKRKGQRLHLLIHTHTQKVAWPGLNNCTMYPCF